MEFYLISKRIMGLGLGGSCHVVSCLGLGCPSFFLKSGKIPFSHSRPNQVKFPKNSRNFFRILGILPDRTPEIPKIVDLSQFLVTISAINPALTVDFRPQSGKIPEYSRQIQSGKIPKEFPE